MVLFLIFANYSTELTDHEVQGIFSYLIIFSM